MTTKLAIVDQVKKATHKENRLATILGGILGGVIPLATYVLVHQECDQRPILWCLVTGGLIYSAITVWDWACVAFRNPWKSLGFVVLLEGVMTFSETLWLSLMCLILLMAINAISAGCQLALDRRENRRK
jgi:hypothetical protein